MGIFDNILSQIQIIKGDIIYIKADAIVNAANPTLLGGGGVDGAIHRAAGPGLLDECRNIGGCNHGEARITKGYNLKALYIIHTPGPIYKGGKLGEHEVLKYSYLNSMKLAYENKLKSIAFPSISTGVYGYPKSEACYIAMDTVIAFLREFSFDISVYFVLFDNDNYSIYLEYFKSLGSK
jgi:O-acetyl-ADP-ribose deacetylase